MDTTEELNGTYFYGGLHNLTSSELFFWVMVDVTAEHLSGSKEVARDLLASAAIYAGRNNIPVSGKLAGATPGTSIASKFARQNLKNLRLPFPLPTIVGGPLNMKVIMTHKLGTFVGRAIPVVGWVIVASDVGKISWQATQRYNTIARGKDKLW